MATKKEIQDQIQSDISSKILPNSISPESLGGVLSGMTNITGTTYLNEGTDISITGGGSEAEPFIIGFTGVTITDTFVTGATFNTSTGDLDLTRQSGNTVTVNLDDRYSLTAHTHTNYHVEYVPENFDWGNDVATLNSNLILQYPIDLSGTSITINSGTTLDFRGGSFTNGEIVGSGTTIINTSNDAIFDATLTLSGGTWETEGVFLEWFGAQGLGFGTNDLIPMQQAGDFARDFGLKLTCGYNKDFFFTDTDLDWFGIQFIDMPSRIRGNTETRAIEVGMVSTDDIPLNHSFINVFSGTLKYTGGKNGKVYAGRCTKLLLHADSNLPTKASIGYMNITGGKFDKVHITSNLEGWVNENHFYIDRIAEVYIDIDNSILSNSNNNAFYSPTIENGQIWINKGTNNIFHNVRLEGSTVLFTSSAANNLIVLSRTNTKNDFLEDALPNIITTDLGLNNRIVFSDELGKVNKIVYELNKNSENYTLEEIYRNGTNLTVGINFRTIYDSGIFKLDQDMGISYEAIDRGGNPDLFRMFATFYDSDGLQYTGTTDPGYIENSSMPWNSGTTQYNNTVNLGKRSIGITKPLGSAPVLYVRIQVKTGGSVAGNTFDSLTVKAKYNSVNLVNFPTENPQRLVLNTIPTQGTWVIGTKVYNTLPTTTSESVGWICIASGTPGTWEPFGVIGSGVLSEVTTFTASEFGNSFTIPKVGLTGEVGKIKIPIMLKVDYTHVTTGYTASNALEFLGKGGVYIFDDGGETGALSADDSFSNIIGKSINSIGENIDATLGLSADDLTGDGTVVCTVYYNEIIL